jgi:23S rRNA pseudouridine1911/1915/1917 synthase
LAVVTGQVIEGEHIDFLKKYTQKNISKVVEQGGKQAHLTCTLLNQQEELSLIEVELHTGRHHQIRVQTAHHGFPIWGDTKYNPLYQDKKGWHQIALHAAYLSFKHPITKKTITYKSHSEEPPFNNFKIQD